MTDFRDHSGSDHHSNCVAESGGQLAGDTHANPASVQIPDDSSIVDAGGQKLVEAQKTNASSKNSRRRLKADDHWNIAAEGGGHLADDIHAKAASADNSGDQFWHGTQPKLVSQDEAGQVADVTQHKRSGLVHSIRELHRQRQDLHRAEKSLTLQIKGNCRRMVGGDKAEADVLYRAILGKGTHEHAAAVAVTYAAFFEARAGFEASRATVEKQLEKSAKQLPVPAFVKATKGFSWGSLAAVIGEAGDLSMYANPAKLWKRMGYAVMGDGTRQRRVSGVDAMAHGYSPSRRSIGWNIGASIIKSQVRSLKDEGGAKTGESMAIGEYGQLYLDRKAYEAERVETKGHAHNRAQRYVEKRLLRDLWRAWRDASESMTTAREMHPAKPTQDSMELEIT